MENQELRNKIDSLATQIGDLIVNLDEIEGLFDEDLNRLVEHIMDLIKTPMLEVKRRQQRQRAAAEAKRVQQYQRQAAEKDKFLLQQRQKDAEAKRIQQQRLAAAEAKSIQHNKLQGAKREEFLRQLQQRQKAKEAKRLQQLKKAEEDRRFRQGLSPQEAKRIEQIQRQEINKFIQKNHIFGISFDDIRNMQTEFKEKLKKFLREKIESFHSDEELYRRCIHIMTLAEETKYREMQKEIDYVSSRDRYLTYRPIIRALSIFFDIDKYNLQKFYHIGTMREHLKHDEFSEARDKIMQYEAYVIEPKKEMKELDKIIDQYLGYKSYLKTIPDRAGIYY